MFGRASQGFGSLLQYPKEPEPELVKTVFLASLTSSSIWKEREKWLPAKVHKIPQQPERRSPTKRVIDNIPGFLRTHLFRYQSNPRNIVIIKHKQTIVLQDTEITHQGHVIVLMFNRMEIIPLFFLQMCPLNND